MIEVEGTVLNIIFTNESNGYTILKILEKTDGDEIILIGYIPFVNVGDTIKAKGEWDVHNKFGIRFKVESFEKSMPDTKDAIKFFLASGIIKGVREVIANKIVEKFGDETLDVIRDHPEKLASIQGISKKKALEISKKVSEDLILRKITLFLNENNVPTMYLSIIYKQFGDKTIEKIKENPYTLTEVGINFKIADNIANKLGIDMFLDERNKSAIKYVLYKAMDFGHTYLPLEKLKKSAEKLLKVNDEILDDAIVKLSLDNEVVFEKNDIDTRVYLANNYYAENYVAAKVCQLSLMDYIDDLDEILDGIKEFEKEEKIELEDMQKKAIISAITKGIFILTGGPGTGKTTIIKAIIYFFERSNLNVSLAAPTGRAAKRMTEITGMEAKTIHRLLEVDFRSIDKEKRFLRNENNPIETDVLIVDEMSMVDLLLMRDLLKAITKNNRLILVGDVNQLAPIGVGNVLRDIIDSKKVETVFLKKIFRQAEESLIISNAHKINNGDFPDIKRKDKDFFFISRKTSEDVLKTVVDLFVNRLPKTYAYDPIKHIQVITPMRKGNLGVVNINKELQKAVNPSDKKSQMTNIYKLKVGDKVMQMRNNYDIEWEITGCLQDYGEGIFNGDIGIIDDIDYGQQKVTVIFEEQKVTEYDFDLLDELELAYAITVHKSQGSEFPVVILPILEGPMILFTRNLLYTAVTRAKEMVIIVGLENMIDKMVKNFRIDKKFSALSERIEKYLNK